MKIGDQIKAAREGAGLTQLQLADKMKVTPQNISQYERNKKNPKPDTIKKIADALEVSIDYLLNCADDPNEMKTTHESDWNIPILSHGLYNSVYQSSQIENKGKEYKEIDDMILKMKIFLSKLAQECDKNGVYDAMFMSLNAPFFDHITNSFKQSIHQCINILKNIDYFKKDGKDNELNIDDIYLLLGTKKEDYDEKIKKMQMNLSK